MNNLKIENIKIALSAIKSQFLRSFLTAFIIAIGITALVGILTAIDALKSSINNQFSAMGANSFSIVKKSNSNKRRGGKKETSSPSITYREAMQFQKAFDVPARVTISCQTRFNAVVSFNKTESKPNIAVFGADENYIDINGFAVASGRNLSRNDLKNASQVAVLGSDIKTEIFGNNNAIDQIITVSNIRFRVIGVLAQKGSSMGFGGDRSVLIPIPSGRQYFGYPNMPFNIGVITNDPNQLELAVNEAIGLFRTIRKDPLGSVNSFEINRSNAVSEQLIANLGSVTLISSIIAGITLLGAAIGLMNIMLVSVTERTKEIGVRKALGANNATIRSQFLTEAIIICQIGGVLGIITGITIGNVVAKFIDGNFIIPWLWIIVSIILSFLVGVLAGFFPANKAANLDPIESLRYE